MSALAALSRAAMPLPLAANGAPVPRAGADAGGGILHMLAVARGAAVLFGWHAARLPRQGSALAEHAGGRLRGVYRLHAWRRDEAGTAWFVAALQLREQDALPAAASLSIQLADRPAIALGALPHADGTPEALAQRLAADAGEQPGPVALFLADLCIAAPRAAPLQALLGAFLRHAAEEDGVVEILGQAHASLVMQGWGRADLAQPAVALLADGAVSRHPVAMARFARADIRPPAGGLVAVLRDAQQRDPASLGVVHLASGPALYRRPVLPGRQLLDAAQTAGHLRDMLPTLTCAAETEAELRRLLRPVFTGHDTLSALDRPVRAAVDLAAVFPGVGAFLSGWMVDAEGEGNAVALRGRDGLSLRLDQGWTRLPRPDVAEAFRADARFAALSPDRHLHGFARFVADATIAASPPGLHLELAIGEGVAFLPVRQAGGAPRTLLRRALESIDLHRAGAQGAIAAQLGPLAQALLRAGPDLPPAEVLSKSRAVPRTALLLPLPEAGPPPHVALSFLLGDPLAAEEGLVLVAPSCWGERELAALAGALPLYARDATVLHAAEPACWTELLELAARATDAERFLCLGAGVIGRQPGWRRQLSAATDGAVRFPTALYEDDAVRSRGVAAVERLAAAPWARLVRPGAGMPAAAMPAEAAGRDLVAGSLAGAQVPRAAWQRAGGFAGGGLLAAAQEFAFFRRLIAAGGAFTHSPAVAVHAVAEAPAGPSPRWQQAARLVDGWLLAAGEEERN